MRAGEKSTKYFFGLEKKRYLDKNMKCIINERGETLWELNNILEEQTKFYMRLYSKDPKVSFTLQRHNLDPKLDQEEKCQCDKPLLVDEIFDAIMTLKGGKCAGGDGLPIEFYHEFYNEIKQPLYQMFVHAYNLQLLPLSTRRGMISLLPKKGKDRRYVKNMRPLTLLNCDYKILAKIFDNRMKSVLPNLTHSDQTGFPPGRNISTNIRKSLDVMEFCSKNKKPAVIMSIDMEKCFDRVDYEAIYGKPLHLQFWRDVHLVDLPVSHRFSGMHPKFWIPI